MTEVKNTIKGDSHIIISISPAWSKHQLPTTVSSFQETFLLEVSLHGKFWDSLLQILLTKSFWKALRTNPLFWFPDAAYVCVWSSQMLVWVIMTGPVIFYQSECWIRRQMCCICETMPFMQALIFSHQAAHQLVSCGFIAHTTSPVRAC